MKSKLNRVVTLLRLPLQCGRFKCHTQIDNNLLTLIAMKYDSCLRHSHESRLEPSDRTGLMGVFPGVNATGEILAP